MFHWVIQYVYWCFIWWYNMYIDVSLGDTICIQMFHWVIWYVYRCFIGWYNMYADVSLGDTICIQMFHWVIQYVYRCSIRWYHMYIDVSLGYIHKRSLLTLSFNFPYDYLWLKMFFLTTVLILLCWKKPTYKTYRLFNDSCYGYWTVRSNALLEKNNIWGAPLNELFF